MGVTLFRPANHPNQIAVSKIASFPDGGMFFLDFSRPVEIRRWFGLPNRWVGFAVSMLVPVIHQGQEQGEYVISVGCSDPYFADLRALWKAHYPSIQSSPSSVVDGLKIIADFATQFPEGC